VQVAFPRTEAVGAVFGVVLVIQVVAGERVATEVATFRHDGAYSDGRRPDAVRFSLDPREDALRRDFTINGMLYDPTAVEGQEAVLDFVGGRGDLEERWIRTIGRAETRFTEDKLRMLRGVRFAARLGFNLFDTTAEAMAKMAGDVAQVSAERVRDEIPDCCMCCCRRLRRCVGWSSLRSTIRRAMFGCIR